MRRAAMAEELGLDAVRFEPKPRTRPRIEVGGNSRRALRRAARFGDAWHAIQLGPNAIRQSARTLRSFGREVGRENPVAITLRCTLDASRDLPPDAPPWRLGGSGDRFADAIGRYVDAGVETFVFDLQPEGDEAGHRRLLADLPALVRSPAT